MESRAGEWWDSVYSDGQQGESAETINENWSKWEETVKRNYEDYENTKNALEEQQRINQELALRLQEEQAGTSKILQQLSAAQKTRIALESENKKLKASLRSETSAKVSYSKEFAEVSSSVKKYQLEASEVQAKLTIEKDMLKEATRQISAVQQSYDKGKQKWSESKSQYETTINQLSQELEHAKKALDIEQQKSAKLELDLDVSEGLKLDLSDQLSLVKQNYEQEKQQCLELKTQLTAALQDREYFSLQVKSAQRELKAAQQKPDFENQVKTMQRKNRDLAKKLKRTKEQLEESEQNCAVFECALGKSEKKADQPKQSQHAGYARTIQHLTTKLTVAERNLEEERAAKRRPQEEKLSCSSSASSVLPLNLMLLPPPSSSSPKPQAPESIDRSDINSLYLNF